MHIYVVFRKVRQSNAHQMCFDYYYYIYVSLVKFIYDTIHTYTIYSPSIMYLVVGPFFEHI